MIIFLTHNLNRLGFKCCSGSHFVLHETLCKVTSEKKINIFLYICMNLTKIFNQHFVLCIKCSAKLNFEIFIKAADSNITPVNFLKSSGARCAMVKFFLAMFVFLYVFVYNITQRKQN